eukprot:TRINITY_DN21096_c0_g1_i7.p4 TRINITY_DN21096_c0_g1~~TRINITY_DN21096_c0_g1_i7.p4  ORF type:complete len:104 (-),score=13.30 TRINITY_DN21096_c0_g1_i7:219-530(-)
MEEALESASRHEHKQSHSNAWEKHSVKLGCNGPLLSILLHTRTEPASDAALQSRCESKDASAVLSDQTSPGEQPPVQKIETSKQRTSKQHLPVRRHADAKHSE